MRGNKLEIKSISRRNKWCDKDVLMVHACFQILIDCVEKEDLFRDLELYLAVKVPDELQEEASKILEIRDLYRWWVAKGYYMTCSEITSEEVTKKLHRLIDLKSRLWT